MIRRILSAVVTVWLAVTAAFVVLRVLPGDAIRAQLLQSGASEELIATRRARLGLDDPPWMQYLTYLAGLPRGDLGISLVSGESVAPLLLSRLRPTVELAVLSLALAVSSGVVAGLLEGSTVSVVRWVSRGWINTALALPVYWTGTLALFVVSLNAGVLVPALVLGFHGSGAIARVVAAELRQIRGSDFVRTAHAKGLRRQRVLLRHVLPVLMLPALPVITLQAGILFGGTVITETLFLRPGLGRLLLERVLLQDYPVVQGAVLLSTSVYLLLNGALDLALRWLDPRIRHA